MSWKKTKLGKFLEVRKGKFKPNDPAIANIKRVDKIDFSGQIHLSGKSSNTDMILIKQGDLLISGINVAKGAVTVYEGEEDIVATVHYSSYVYDADRIDITFLKLFLQSPEFFDAIREQIPGGIKTEIKPKHLLPLEVVIPSTLTEQREVAASYFAFQAKQNLLDSELCQQITHLTQLRQALLSEAMQGQLLPQDPTDEPAALLLEKLQAAKASTGKGGKRKAGALFAEEPVEGAFAIPYNWVWCTLNSCSINFDGQRKPIALSDRAKRERVYDYYGASGVIDQIDGYTHEGEFLLIGEDGANLVSRSTPIAFIASGKFWVNNHAHVIGTLDRVTLDYLCYYLNSLNLKPFITGGFQPKLSQGNLNIIPVPFPPLAEQHRIVAKLEQLMQHCDALEQRIRESRRLAEQLLQTALREALAPPAGTEPAEEDELELAEAAAAPEAPRRGRPRKQRLSVTDPNFFKELEGLFDTK